MRRVFILKKDGEFVNENNYVAYYGFVKLGYEIHFFEGDPPENIGRGDIVVGYISTVKKAIKNLGITPPTEIDYPEELSPFYGRKIWESNLNKISEKDFPIFIKPKSGKQFDGRLVKDFSNLIGCTFDPKGSCEIWCSEPVVMIAEWRVFVRYGFVQDARKYKGSPFVQLNEDIVMRAIDMFDNPPAAYSMDFALTDTGETVIIEVNDGYALGSYGLFPTLYSKMISARWAEMSGSYDELSMIGNLERFF